MTINRMAVSSANQVKASSLSRSSLRAFCASSRPSTLASAYRPEQHPQLHQALLARSPEVLSLDERLICQPPASSAVYEAIKPRQRVVFDVAFVQPKRKFIDVAAKVFRTRMMIYADQPAFENCKNAFRPVRGHVASHVFARAVIDGIVAEPGIANARIRAAFIGMQGRSGLDVPMNGGLDRFLVRALYWHSDRAPASLAHAEHRRFADRAASSLELLGFMLVLFDPAHVGFVDFDNALQHFELRSARFAQPMKDKPRRLLRDPDFLGELHGRNALARRHKQIHRVNPLVQRDMRALENRASANREVLFALIAAIEAFLARREAFAKPANWAVRPVRPKAAFKINTRSLLVREHLKKLKGRNRALGHRATPRLRRQYRIKWRGSQLYNSL